MLIGSPKGADCIISSNAHIFSAMKFNSNDVGSCTGNIIGLIRMLENHPHHSPSPHREACRRLAGMHIQCVIILNCVLMILKIVHKNCQGISRSVADDGQPIPLNFVL